VNSELERANHLIDHLAADLVEDNLAQRHALVMHVLAGGRLETRADVEAFIDEYTGLKALRASE
jgi:hypothetical protein